MIMSKSILRLTFNYLDNVYKLSKISITLTETHMLRQENLAEGREEICIQVKTWPPI